LTLFGFISFKANFCTNLHICRKERSTEVKVLRIPRPTLHITGERGQQYGLLNSKYLEKQYKSPKDFSFFSATTEGGC
jgi:hypothetical protein